jgi:hypothetical protein
MDAAPPRSPASFATGSIAVGAAVAGLTLVVFQWLLLLTETPSRIFLPVTVLFVVQSVFNGVVIGCLLGDLSDRTPPAGGNSGAKALRRVSLVLGTVLVGMSGVLPLAFAWKTGGKIFDAAVVLAIGGLMAAAVLAIVLVPAIYAFAIRRLKNSWSNS